MTLGQVPSIQQPAPLGFELLAEIATGPTARVELCRVREPATHAGKLCAVKRLHPHIAEDPQFYGMFVDEVWMTAALDHPNIVHVVGWGTDQEGTYLAVELVEGVSLARLMKTVFETREAFNERMVVYIGLELCAGLAAAHGLTSPQGEHLRLVHRDLTPGNVLVGFDGRVLIADFGLAKAKQRVTKTLTGLLKGHPQYMAPEQAGDGEIDARADLFSLGVLLFELFSGRHPWTGGTELEVFHVMAKEPPADLAALRPRIDRELLAVVNKLLEKDPQKRFASALEVYERLANWLDTHGYREDNADAVARFVRRNAMRQMRWFERAVAGEFVAEATRAKARLLGARVKPSRATSSGLSMPTGHSRLSKPAPPPVPSPAARRRTRRPYDESTDVSDMAARFGAAAEREDAPASGETPDWNEEVPTVVQPKARPPGLTKSPEVAIESLPSFADDESDGKTTTVKAKVAAIVMRDSVTQPRQPNKGLLAPRIKDLPTGAHGTVLNLPVVPDDFDTEESDEVPTSPIRVKTRPLAKLPPPPVRPASEVPPAPDTINDDPTTLPRDRRRPRSEADVRAEATRLVGLAHAAREKADKARKLASHRAVLAELARDAAELAHEAVELLGETGLEDAAKLVLEAHRLEDAYARGESEGPGALADVVDSVPAPQAEPSLPPPGFSEPARISVAPSFGPPPEPAPRDERPSYEPPPPSSPAPAFPVPPPKEPVRLAALDPAAQDRPSFLPMLDPRKEPTQPSTKYQDPFGRSEVRQILQGEVFGVPVPVALAVAFLIALAMVVLVWIVVG